MLNKDSAICIRTVDYSETSQILAFFSKDHGKISVISKGSRKKNKSFDGPVEMLSFGQIAFTQTNKDNLGVLTEFQQQKHFSNLSKDLFNMNCCLLAAELVDKCTEMFDPHPLLFGGCLDLVTSINDSTSKNESLALLILFLRTLLSETGTLPIMNKCVSCKTNIKNNPDNVYFSNTAKGLLCRDCEGGFEDKIKISKNAANIFCNIRNITTAEEKNLTEIVQILLFYLRDSLGKNIKMAKYIVS